MKFTLTPSGQTERALILTFALLILNPPQGEAKKKRISIAACNQPSCEKSGCDYGYTCKNISHDGFNCFECIEGCAHSKDYIETLPPNGVYERNETCVRIKITCGGSVDQPEKRTLTSSSTESTTLTSNSTESTTLTSSSASTDQSTSIKLTPSSAITDQKKVMTPMFSHKECLESVKVSGTHAMHGMWGALGTSLAVNLLLLGIIVNCWRRRTKETRNHSSFSSCRCVYQSMVDDVEIQPTK